MLTITESFKGFFDQRDCNFDDISKITMKITRNIS